MSSVSIPPALSEAAARDASRSRWLQDLPDRIRRAERAWELRLGDPYLPGGQTAWVAPAVDPAGDELVLKISWRHPESEHEADGLRHWDGDGAVRCIDDAKLTDDTSALLLERCVPGQDLGSAPEHEQDVVIAGLLRRLWSKAPAPGHPFQTLAHMCEMWAESTTRRLNQASAGLQADLGLVGTGLELMRELPASAEDGALLCTDLHAANVLSAEREPWLAIDPKPYVGDPAYDTTQHMLNCAERLATDPVGLAGRMAALTGCDSERVRLWLFARCAQESIRDPSMRHPARLLAR